MIEETEGLAGHVGFEPEGYLAQLDGEGIEVHAIDAIADHVADGLPESGRARLVVAGAEDGAFRGDATRRSEEDVTGAAGDIADPQAQERLGGEPGVAGG